MPSCGIFLLLMRVEKIDMDYEESTRFGSACTLHRTCDRATICRDDGCGGQVLPQQAKDNAAQCVMPCVGDHAGTQTLAPPGKQAQ